MDDEKTPVPDLGAIVGARQQGGDDVVGPPGTSGLSFEDAVGLHPDLGKLWTESRESFDKMASVNDELAKASDQNLAIPGGPEKLYRANVDFARHLDRVFTLLGRETDQIRIELLRTMYANLCPYWQSLLIQTHMGRAQIKNPEKVHETLLGEATALLDRVRARV